MNSVGQRSYARILLKASTDDTAGANIEINCDFDLALDDFERALQAASDVEPDLIAAAHLRAEERAQDRVLYRTAASLWAPGRYAQPASARLDTLRHRYIYVLGKMDAQKTLCMTPEVITVPEARANNQAILFHERVTAVR